MGGSLYLVLVIYHPVYNVLCIFLKIKATFMHPLSADQEAA
jgi:hypothetical protein